MMTDDRSALICPITYKLMKEPVITPQGISFERAAIVSWIERHGNNPITLEELSVADLVPNLALRDEISRQISIVKSSRTKVLRKETEEIDLEAALKVQSWAY